MPPNESAGPVQICVCGHSNAEHGNFVLYEGQPMYAEGCGTCKTCEEEGRECPCSKFEWSVSAG